MVQVQPGYAADWMANETGGSFIAFGAGSRLLKANSSDLYPEAPPAALPNASFALGFAYPVEGLAVGDQLVVRLLSMHVNFPAHFLFIFHARTGQAPCVCHTAVPFSKQYGR